MPRLGRTLAARILAAVLGIVVVTLAVGVGLLSPPAGQPPASRPLTGC